MKLNNLNQKYTFDSFIVGICNKFAYVAAKGCKTCKAAQKKERAEALSFYLLAALERLAQQRGRARMSAQAVGGAVGHNEISIIVPCHRVVGKNGSLTGYAGGIDKKTYLLKLEGGYEEGRFCIRETYALEHVKCHGAYDYIGDAFGGVECRYPGEGMEFHGVAHSGLGVCQRYNFSTAAFW